MFGKVDTTETYQAPTEVLMGSEEIHATPSIPEEIPATSETYGPRVYSHHINLHHFNLSLLFTLHLYTKNTKNIISIRSHSRK